MAIKQEYLIDCGYNDEYIISGQSGIYKNTGYKETPNYPVLEEKANTERFTLIDLWQLGTFGSENVKQTYDAKEDINIIKEEDVYKFASKCIKEITDGLENAIAQAIIEEIEEDGEETVKLIKNENAKYCTKPVQIIDVQEDGEESAKEIINEQGNIDDLTKYVTDGLHDGIKADILAFAYEYCDKMGYDLDD